MLRKNIQPFILKVKGIFNEPGKILNGKALLKLNVDSDTMVIGADTRDSCSEKRVKGDPAG
jgi:hypothetical protein